MHSSEWKWVGFEDKDNMTVQVIFVNLTNCRYLRRGDLSFLVSVREFSLLWVSLLLGLSSIRKWTEQALRSRLVNSVPLRSLLEFLSWLPSVWTVIRKLI